MSARRWSVAAAAAVGLVVLAPAAASASDTPAGTGGGCKENGQAVAGAARGPDPFGQFVRTQAPIADDVAGFFALCQAADQGAPA